VTSTPTGGSLPFQTTEGVVHYYGNAYLRPIEDARRAGVRFTSECLAFSHLPEPDAIDELAAIGVVPGSSPRWKERIPRDAGASWDFEDVRDHAVATMFGVDPLAIRYADPERWMALGRVATGEYLASVISEWRRAGSGCGGALIYTLRDLVLGAGWGVHDAAGRPKAAHWYLRRVFATRTILATDEGLNGLDLHIINDHADCFAGTVGVTLYRAGDVVVEQAQQRVDVAARSVRRVHADAMFDGFRDLTYAYKFGPPGHDAVYVELRDHTGSLVADTFYFPVGLSPVVEPDVGLVAGIDRGETGEFELWLESARLAVGVRIDVPGYRPVDNYVHLAPRRRRTIPLVALDPSRPPSGHVTALNSARSTRAVLDER
jgi:beta-mannosidase